MARDEKRRGVAELRGFGDDGNLVEEVELSLDDYYDGLHELIDSDEYRATRGIRRIEGTLLDLDGNREQEFRNDYSPAGTYIGGRTEFADGTVNES